MEIIRGEELVERVDELVNRAASDERIIITCGGKQAALVSFDDLEFLEDVDRKLDERDAEEARRLLADPTQVPVGFVPTTFTPTRQ